MKWFRNILTSVVVLVLAILFDNHIFKEKEVDNNRRTLFWTFVSIALFGAFLGLLGCAKMPPPYTSVYPVAFPPSMNNMAAVTECEMGGQPIILINSNLAIPKMFVKYILIHERQHATDMRMQGCVSTMERIQKEPDLLMWLEVRAYCAQWVAMNNDGMFPQPSWQFRMMFEEVYDKYGKHLPKEVFFNRVPCRPSDPP